MAKTVYTYGVWDLLHSGHIRLLQKANEFGDVLIVGVVKDKAVRKKKGKDRPIRSEYERLAVIKALKMVDHAILQDEFDPSNEMRTIGKINVLVKGDDWDYIPGTEAIEEMGGMLIKLKYTDGISTSDTVKKIKCS